MSGVRGDGRDDPFAGEGTLGANAAHAGPWRWRDACDTARDLGPRDRAVLLLVARLPLVWADVLRAIVGLRGAAAVYRSLASLRRAGLLATLDQSGGLLPALTPAARRTDLDHRPNGVEARRGGAARRARLLYLTDLGVATAAAACGADAHAFARRYRLDREAVLARLPALPQLTGAYALTAVLASSRHRWPELLAWERPYRFSADRYQNGPQLPALPRAPAYAAIRWRGSACSSCVDSTSGADSGCAGAAASYVLFADYGLPPLEVHRRTVTALVALRSHDLDARAAGRLGAADPPFPCVVIGTRDQDHAEEWWTFCLAVCRRRREPPLELCITTWDAVRSNLRRGGPVAWLYDTRAPESECGPSHRLAQHLALPPFRRRVGGQALPRPVSRSGGAAERRRPGAGALARTALQVTAEDRVVLDLLAQHPFLSAAALAAVLGGGLAWPGVACTRLVRLGLARRVRRDEIPAGQWERLSDQHRRRVRYGLLELTATGLRLAAAQHGLTLHTAVDTCGYAGGGPENPLGQRTGLLEALAHTLEADETFARFFVTVHRLRRRGVNARLADWHAPGGCSSGQFRPDGYAQYREGDRVYPFYFEYDRGTMRLRDSIDKFTAYYDYRDVLRRRCGDGRLPTTLVVTCKDEALAPLAAAFREVSSVRPPALPVLATTTTQLAGHPEGFLGAIWRDMRDLGALRELGAATPGAARWTDCIDPAEPADATLDI